MFEDDKGRIWIGCVFGAGLYILDIKDGIIKHLKEKSMGINNIIGMMMDEQGKVWFTTPDNNDNEQLSTGVYIIDEKEGTIKHFSKAQGLSRNDCFGIFEDHQKNVWIGTYGGGATIVDQKKGTLRYLNKARGLSTDSIHVIMQEDKNKIWISSSNRTGKINVVDVQNGTITHYAEKQGIPKDYQYRLLKDEKGNIWIGTKEHGVYIIDLLKGATKNINVSSGLSGNFVSSPILMDDRGQIWIGTDAGLDMVNRGGNEIEHVGQNEIYSVLEDPHGKVWIGKNGTGVEILDRSTGLIKDFTGARGISYNYDAPENIIGENSNIWLVGAHGIDIVNSTYKIIEHLGKTQGLRSDYVVTCTRDKNNKIWIGFYLNGIDILDMQRGIISHFGAVQGIKDTAITEIKEDKEGNVWIGTLDEGLIYVVDPGNNTIKYLANGPELKCGGTKIFLQDEQGNMWIGSYEGIYMVDAGKNSITRFSTREGLLSDDINSLNE